MVLADHSKQNNVSPFAVGQWRDVHTLVSDHAWPEVEALGVDVVVTP
jgi:DeoR/GlpR family transcriptional regulator of sugar metabolism